MKSDMSVSTNPGQNATDLTPLAATSLFIARVYAITAALVAAYTDSHGCGDFPAIDAMFTTSALPCSAPAADSISRHSR